jgi:multiple sugar transport system substrate-binding protein
MGEKKSREEFQAKLENMVSTLRQQIMNGEIAVGDYLPSELSLAERFNLSKNSVRKGLDELVSEGLIVKKSRVGNLVVSNQPFDQIILRVGYYPSLLKEAKLHELIKKFEQEYSYIKVQTIALPYDHYHQTVSDFFKSDMLDVVSINYNDFCNFKESAEEIFEPLDVSDNIYPFLQEPLKVSFEKTLVKPFIFSPVVLCYNREHFERNRIPTPDSGWKWKDVIDAAMKLSNEEGTDRHCGLYFHPLSMNRWPIFLLQNHVKFMREPGGKVAFNKDLLLESMNVIRDLFEKQGILQTFLSDSDKDAEKLFLEQKVSMIIASYFSLNEMKDNDIPYDIAPLPYISIAKTILLIIGFAVNKESTKIEAAKKFVEFMVSDPSQEFIRQETLSIPSVKTVAERIGDEKVFKPSRYQLFREIIPTFSLYSDLGLTYRELGEMKNELRLFLSGLLTEELFCQRLQANLSKPQEIRMKL